MTSHDNVYLMSLEVLGGSLYGPRCQLLLLTGQISASLCIIGSASGLPSIMSDGKDIPSQHR